MFEKLKTKKRIKNFRKQIELLEKKRARSQAALVEAILTQTTPSDEDVDYFNNYTSQINHLRDMIHELQKKLESL